MLIGVLFAYFQLSNFSGSSIARNNQVALNVSNNVALTDGGAGVVIEITSDDFVASAGEGVLNVAELVIDYDESILTLESMQANSSLLSLNESIDANAGQATIDLAQPASEFPAGTTLVTLTFSVLEQTDTVVSLVNPGTTWGYPNRMNFAASNTAFDVDFPEPSSSSTSSMAGCNNTAVGNGRSHVICEDYFIIQAEDFDNGGNGTAYNDLDGFASGSEYDSTYRPDEDVDVKAETNGVRAVGYNRQGEWLDFTVSVPQAGSYQVTARVAMDSSSGRIAVALGSGSNLASANVTNTGSYNTFADVILNNNVDLAAGNNTIRMNVVQQYFDIDYLRFDLQSVASSSTTTTTTTSSQTASSATTTSSTSTTTTTSSTTTTTTTTSTASSTTTSSVSTTTSSATSSATSSNTSTAENDVEAPLYRFYNSVTGAHFYTISDDQAQRVRDLYSPPFDDEGIGYYVYSEAASDRTAVYKFYNATTGAHLYVAGEEARDSVLDRFSDLFAIEPRTGEPAFYVNSEATGTPVYRFYNTSTGTHFYTASINQRNTVLTDPRFSAFEYEGIKYYAPKAE